MAVLSNDVTKVTVYNLNTRQVVRQGFFCPAQCGPLRAAPGWLDSLSWQSSLEMQDTLLARSRKSGRVSS